MKKHISIISRLKKIAITSLDLGREIAKDKATHAADSLRATPAGHFLDNTRLRLDQALARFNSNKLSARTIKIRAAAHQHPADTGKRHAGARKAPAHKPR
jgi:hypothetical protein